VFSAILDPLNPFHSLASATPPPHSFSHLQVTPAPRWAATLQSAAAAVQSAARAAAAAALLALPLIAMARPFRAQQLLPAATAATHIDATAATAAATAAAASPAAVGGVLLNDRLLERQLGEICIAVQQRLQGQIWLSSTNAQVDDVTAASILSSSSSGAAAAASIPSSSSSSGGGSNAGLMYQVVVDGSGRVLGVSPCSPAAAAAVWELPLLVDVKGASLAKVQDRSVVLCRCARVGSGRGPSQPFDGSKACVCGWGEGCVHGGGSVFVCGGEGGE
jgi:hypothetical protein